MKQSEQVLRQFFASSKAVLSLTLALATAFAPSMSLALNVQIQRAVNLRNEDSSGLHKVGKLAAGSIVSIPDQYAVRKNGSIDFESTLNNWLTKASTLANDPGLKSFDGTKKDYYFPVKVVKAADGSTLGNLDSYMVALHYLHRKGALLETTGETPLLAKQDQAPSTDDQNVVAMANPATDSASDAVDPSGSTSNSAASATVSAANDFEASADCAQCRSQSPAISQPLNADAQWLAQVLNLKLQKPLDKMHRRTTDGVQQTMRTFEKTCGMSFASFLPALRQEIDNSSLKRLAPNALNTTLMLSLMTQESGGNCRSDHSEGAGRSVGLFQVNTTGSTSALKNPILNARAALNKLEAKYAALSRDFDFSKMSEEDRLRVVISAYNGGEGWVSQAKQDLLQFNQRQGTNLDYNSWENLRIFYFRHFLDRRTEYGMFGSVRGPQRKVSNSLLNLSYTENLVPRPQAPVYGYNVQQAWRDRVSG